MVDAKAEETGTDLLEDSLDGFEEILDLVKADMKSANAIGRHTDFGRRTMFRTTFAGIEAISNALKTVAKLEANRRGFSLTTHEQCAIDETELALDRGEFKPTGRRLKVALKENVLFSIAIFAKVNEIDNPIDTSLAWWEKFQRSIKVRDRITHPKKAADLSITDDEMCVLIDGSAGLLTAIGDLLYSWAHATASIDDD